MSESHAAFKQRRTAAQRKQEVERLKEQFPNKIPVIVERYKKEKVLPVMDKSKFLLPEDLSVAQFASIVRNRLNVTGNHAFYLIINKRTMASMTETIGKLYCTEHDEDGFMYVTYASQEAFGC
jgi:microtubule-associated protein 1 light chain